MSASGGPGPDRIDAALARLPTSIEPPRDLWPAIEDGLEPRTRRPQHRWVWAAAAGLFVAVGSSLITATLLRDGRPGPEQQAATASGGPAVVAAAFGPGQRVGPAYLATRRVLARELEARLDRLPPEARRQLERNLEELRRASAEINAALELKPGDPLLEELLLNAYRDEIEVLANANQLAGAGGEAATYDATRMQL